MNDVTIEHKLLLRHWAGLQDRVSRQSCEQMRRCQALEAELMRLRARWVLATTQMLWGLGWPGLPATARHAAVLDSDAQEDALEGLPASAEARAAALICRTGCAGHAHAWLGDEGECKLTGGDCTRVGARAERTLAE